MDRKYFSELIKNFDFETLFIELGWDRFGNIIPVAVNDTSFELAGIAQKRGFVILLCKPAENGNIPLSNVRKKIENHVTKLHQEHLIIYADTSKTEQIWQFVIREKDKPRRIREIRYNINQNPEILYQRARGLLFTLDEEDKITLIDVVERFKQSFGKNTENIIKKFYTEFKKQHTAFLSFIEGIDDILDDKENKNKQWYASLMLNRLMFCYFIQKRGYLDNDHDYLQNKLKEVKEKAGPNQFYNFYREFLLQFFHNGLGKPEKERKLTVEIGKIPYLNGGLFDLHELERNFKNIKIKDEAFEKIFNFFDKWEWTLDIRPDATGKEINPDVIGYIFEKYINDRTAMGAYYTKEDITEYIGKNTIIPSLFDKVKKACPKPFEKDGFIWQYLKNSGDTYIYDALKKGIPNEGGLFDDLPEEIKRGFIPELEKKIVKEDTKPHLWEIRMPWNKKAPEEIALPTETYRELIERRKRYAEVKSKIENGEISDINDFITYNLNIRQFTQDILENTEDPDLIRHFFKAIRSVTILDPTCGSGAFLFAALNILEPLYEACIQRMEQFTAETPQKYKFFHEVLAEVNSDEHPNLQYYIFKSIILNNLYGVDIMHEAVEIAKLRLFLKMVGAVDPDPRKPNYDLEPLPDIDFNIKTGNTLVGFATEEEFRNAVYEKEPLFEKEIMEEFEVEFEITAKAFKRFQDSQLIADKGTDAHRKAKQELLERLDKLNEKLNYYLASAYGIDRKEQPKKYENWLKTHQPFHWFAEFYEIIHGNGGFDVIIGNPPYVEYSQIKQHYKIVGYKTESSGNLYVYVAENSYKIINHNSRVAFIVQLPIVCTDRMQVAQEMILSKNCWISTYDDRPGKLFDRLEHIRATIFITDNMSNKCQYSTMYHRWYSEYRNFLFETIIYGEIVNANKISAIPKTGGNIFKNIYEKIKHFKPLSINIQSKMNQHSVFYHNAPQYFIRAMNYTPYFWNEKQGEKVSNQVKQVNLDDSLDAKVVAVLYNSNIFYLWFILHSDCRHLNKREIETIPISLVEIEVKYKNELSKQYNLLINNFEKNKCRKQTQYKTTGKVIYDEYYPKYSKPIIDQIDTVLAEHYGFTEEELDFIINYDIKYRMGKELEAYVNGSLGKECGEEK